MGVKVWAQTKISARLDSTHIYVGDALKMQVTVQVPEGTRIIAPRKLKDSIGIEQLDTARSISLVRNGDLVFTQIWTLTAFDTGRYTLPPLAFGYEMRSGSIDTLFTPILQFDAIPKSVDTTKVRLIAPIMEEPLTWSDIQYWFWGIIAVILAYFGYETWKKRRKIANENKKNEKYFFSPIINQLTVYFILTCQHEISNHFCNIVDEHFEFCSNNR